MKKKRIKTISVGVFILFALILVGCKVKNNKTPLVVSNIEWENITEQRIPKALPLPLMCNIDEMIALDSSLLLRNNGLETVFTVLSTPECENYMSFGTLGSGPGELLPTAMVLHGYNSNGIRVFDNNSIKKYINEGDSIILAEEVPYNGEPNFYQQIYAITDSLGCAYKASPKETGVHLINIYTLESYDCVTVDQGYFDDKKMPYALTFSVYKDRLIIGRMKFNQIEMYHIDMEKKKLFPLFVVNYKNASPDYINQKGACYMKDINADEYYFYMLNQDTDRPGEETYIDVYTWEGKPVKRLQLDALYLRGVLLNGIFYLKKRTDDDHLYILHSII